MAINKRLTVIILISSLILDIIAFSCILPLFPTLIDFYGSNERRDWLYNSLEKWASLFQKLIGIPMITNYNNVIFGGLLGSLFCLLQFLSSPILGAFSDVYGRKSIMVMWAQARTFSIFVLSRIIAGLSKASTSISLAIIADIYPENTVGKGMALIGVAFSVGFILGPMLGAYFSSTSPPAQIAIYITIIELFLVIFLMSETLESSKRRSEKVDLRRNCLLYINPFALFNFHAVSTATTSTNLAKMRSYGRFYFFYMFQHSGLEFTLSFFTHVQFGYNRCGILRRLSNEKQLQTALISIALLVPAYLIIAFGTTSLVFYIGLSIYALASAVVVPATTSSVSLLASDNTKGVTLGVFRCLGALARSLGPLFSSSSKFFWLMGPTICYVFGGFMFIISYWMLSQLIRDKTKAKAER
ncbi:unnamed protein product [Dracunculus medinensis]|uniref:MFS domain-containing protein n=1 Tax=Dracunculus medinensis TaxID=318479 RepID=A0A0N4U0Y8_DRAME|nr:unnamed protein product [Dracunculus medinensis]